MEEDIAVELAPDLDIVAAADIVEEAAKESTAGEVVDTDVVEEPGPTVDVVDDPTEEDG